ncbi:hypothetical protein BJ508DRAFT_412419 [Ascobolus immersus RN42]|uniref:gamma-glutamylcyclotransferase n=1 Tax=Ascobolus immersus RN42 TaxID=1160509 RepID=A0A3N4IFU0_ASCIM|nr:hypothetical protein BJ508DRAFT_412419 [Ascobolus immersus RN42]
MNDPVAPTATAIPYLAYGSNLASSTFRGRRQIKPLSAHVVYVPSLKLVFDLPGIPYLEPRFANVAVVDEEGVEVVSTGDAKVDETKPLLDTPTKEKTLAELKEDDNVSAEGTKGLYGVVYYVTPEDYAKIVATEGGGTSYADVMVDCVVLPKSELAPSEAKVDATDPANPDFHEGEKIIIKAHTLLAPKSKTRQVTPQGHPSPRYLGLLTSGAAEHSMPTVWQNYLQKLPTYTATTFRQKAGRVLFMAVWMPMFMTFFTIGRLVTDKEGRAPKWWGAIMNGIFKAVWGTYDSGFRQVFGEGERGTGHYDEKVAGWGEDDVERVEEVVEGGHGGQ